MNPPSRAPNVLAFCLIAYALAWGWWGGMLLMGLRVAPGSNASHLPGLMAPALAAFAVTAASEGRAGVMRLARKIWRWPKRPLAVLLAIALPPVLAGGTLFYLAQRGQPFPNPAAFAAYPGLPAGSGVGGMLAVLVLNGYGEEIGWRGVLFDRLAQQGSDFRAALWVALIWMLWHLPLFWLNLSMQGLLGPMALGWAVGLTLGSFVLAHLYRFSGGSLLAVVVWHVVYNFSVATTATAGAVAAVVSTAVMIWGAVVAVLWWRGRLDAPARSGQTALP